MRLRIERHDDEVAPGWAASAMRWAVWSGLPLWVIGLAVPSLVAALAAVSVLWSLVVVVSVVADTERRGIHDKVAGTVVVASAVPAA